MTDIVKRLRSEVGSFKDMIERRLEAADEIERLRDLIEQVQDADCNSNCMGTDWHTAARKALEGTDD